MLAQGITFGGFVDAKDERCEHDFPAVQITVGQRSRRRPIRVGLDGLYAWYFQRYISHLPAAGEMVSFDRSWYNRAGVEKVMGFCTPEQHAEFLQQKPLFERMLARDGITLTKFWFSVSPAEQRTRFAIRLVDPVRQWKFSPTDIDSVDKWDAYTAAKEEMFEATDTDIACATCSPSRTMTTKATRLSASRIR